jgi:hypothetical protein
MLAELRLQDHFAIMLLPVPRALSADCGMVLRLENKDCAAIVAILRQEGLEPFTVYSYTEGTFAVVECA